MALYQDLPVFADVYTLTHRFKVIKLNPVQIPRLYWLNLHMALSGSMSFYLSSLWVFSISFMHLSNILVETRC